MAKAVEPKPRRAPVTDPAEIAAMSVTRWKEGLPLIWKDGDTYWAEADVLKEWRVSTGKISCRNDK